eukprot:GFYU01007909.1.p1 GENE.GFYU01007909.1~~GFYU01007909.1.p1  ORF type:complete len:243 (+),score=85.64 GFYU01007909.1:400-1128(+)
MTSDYPYGYSGVGDEVLSKSRNADTKKIADLKETWQVAIGPENPDPKMIPAQWPPKPESFRPALTAYYRALEALAANILRAMALGLKIEENFFDSRIDKHVSALRTLNYPYQSEPPQPGQLRASAHTDYGTITILAQDNVGGLQVKNVDDTWQDVVSPDNSFVVNIGDLMKRWTNDRFLSTLHRVVNASPERRQSMAFFHNLNNGAIVECIDTCKGDGAKYPSISSYEYLMQKHAAAMGDTK